jgi:hypothetical protein
MQLPPRSPGGGNGRGKAPVLPVEESTDLRDRLLGEIADLQDQDGATSWAQGCTPGEQPAAPTPSGWSRPLRSASPGCHASRVLTLRLRRACRKPLVRRQPIDRPLRQDGVDLSHRLQCHGLPN